MRSLIIAAAAVAFAASPAVANGTKAADAAEAPKAAKAEKKICKRLETSGTRMAERVCLTKAQWDKIEN